MANGTKPLKGSVSNLNWFDAQRKHYETPDQIATRFHLRNDIGMRSFSKHAITVSSGGDSIQATRPVPLAIEDAWGLISDSTKLGEWFLPLDWQFVKAGSFKTTRGPTIEGTIADIDAPNLLWLEFDAGGSLLFLLDELDKSSSARRDLPDSENPASVLTVLSDGSNDVIEPHDVPLSTHLDESATPGGEGTPSVITCTAVHLYATRFHRLAFEISNFAWPEQDAVNLDVVPLMQCYGKLLAAYYAS